MHTNLFSNQKLIFLDLEPEAIPPLKGRLDEGSVQICTQKKILVPYSKLFGKKKTSFRSSSEHFRAMILPLRGQPVQKRFPHLVFASAQASIFFSSTSRGMAPSFNNSS
jgi:hypothetical protein